VTKAQGEVPDRRVNSQSGIVCLGSKAGVSAPNGTDLVRCDMAELSYELRRLRTTSPNCSFSRLGCHSDLMTAR
jgi:hypothetical protein